ncbi:MAG: hypothetical protein E7416_01050 [Ruminococcaceae bacterium]|nr:hypothetical protein [Oscillospiraceae bacterium]
MVDSGKKKNLFDRLIIALKPKKEPVDIVEYAERIISDYTGSASDGVRKKKNQSNFPSAIISVIIIAVSLCIIYCTLKIFL